MEKILGTSSVSTGSKTTLVKRVISKLDLNVGDVLVYLELDDGSIRIRKG